MAILTSREFKTVAGGELNPVDCSRILEQITSQIGIIATEIIEGFFCTCANDWVVAAQLSDGNFATYIEARDVVDGIAHSSSKKQAINFILNQLESSEMLSASVGNGRFSKETDSQIKRWQRGRRLYVTGQCHTQEDGDIIAGTEDLAPG